MTAADIDSLPTGWQCYPWPTGWGIGRLTFERVGYAMIPTRFLLAVRTPAMGHGAIVLDLAAKAGAVSVTTIHGVGIDLTAHVAPVVTAKTSSEWSKYAQWRIVHFLLDTDPNHGDPGEVAAIEKAMRPLLDALPSADHRTSGGRYKITDDHLGDVVEVYQQATSRGEGPTRAVANHFGVAHSTAAKWAGHARTRGLLAPATKGGAS